MSHAHPKLICDSAFRGPVENHRSANLPPQPCDSPMNICGRITSHSPTSTYRIYPSIAQQIPTVDPDLHPGAVCGIALRAIFDRRVRSRRPHEAAQYVASKWFGAAKVAGHLASKLMETRGQIARWSSNPSPGVCLQLPGGELPD
jgi:hypothetical protein